MRDDTILSGLSRAHLFPTTFLEIAVYGEAPPETDIIFRLQVPERVGISLVEVYKRVVKSDISLCKKSQKG